MAASGEKNYQNFIGYKDDHEYKIKSLCIMLPKKSTYVTNFDGKTKWMSWYLNMNVEY